MRAEGVPGRTVGGCSSRSKLAGAVGLLSQSPACGPFSRGELVGMGGEGRARGPVLHTEPLLCAQKLPAYGRSIRTYQRKKIKKEIIRLPLKKKKKKCWKSTSHPVWEEFFQTPACVTPPLISNVVKRLSSRFTHCIYDEPEVMTDSPVPICSERVSML